MGKILLSILAIFLSLSSQGQQNLVDSITKELQQPMPDSNRALSMMRLAIDYEVVDTSKAYKAYKEAIKFAEEKKLYYHLGRIYQNQSFLYSAAGNYVLAKAGLETAIENYKRSGHSKAEQWEANAYNDMGNILKVQNESEKAVEYYLQSLSIKEKLGSADLLTTGYMNLSNLFGDMGQHKKQEEYAYKAVEVARKSGIKQHLFMAYFMLSNSYVVQNDTKNAKRFIDSSASYYDGLSNEDNIDIWFSYYLVKGQVFRKMNQLDSAAYFFRNAYELSDKYNYSYGKAESQLQLGAVAILQKKFFEAEKYLVSGIKEAKAINYFGMLDEGYKYLSDVYAETGKYKEAYEYFQQYKEINDSAVNADSKKYIADLEKKYETEKKDAQLKIQQNQLERKNIFNTVLVSGITVFLIIAFLFYTNVRKNQKLQQQRISELEKDKLLTATEAILKGEEQERSRLAKDLHDGLGGMMSGIKYSLMTMRKNQIMTPENQQAFDRSMDMLDSSINEMRRVAHNMMPEALVKFGLDTALNDFCSEVDQTGALQVSYQSIGIKNEDIEQSTAITIYRIVQELINNTMKHASAKLAIVQLSKTNGAISITVEDDGKGFEPAILSRVKGIGWSNIQSRVEYLKGSMDVRSQPGKGTSVHIELNI